MAVNPLQKALGIPRADPAPEIARVVAVEADGVMVAPLDSDLREPIGPCGGRGPFEVGDTVLLIFSADGPWAIA